MKRKLNKVKSEEKEIEEKFQNVSETGQTQRKKRLSDLLPQHLKNKSKKEIMEIYENQLRKISPSKVERAVELFGELKKNAGKKTIYEFSYILAKQIINDISLKTRDAPQLQNYDKLINEICSYYGFLYENFFTAEENNCYLAEVNTLQNKFQGKIQKSGKKKSNKDSNIIKWDKQTIGWGLKMQRLLFNRSDKRAIYYSIPEISIENNDTTTEANLIMILLIYNIIFQKDFVERYCDQSRKLINSEGLSDKVKRMQTDIETIVWNYCTLNNIDNPKLLFYAVDR